MPRSSTSWQALIGTRFVFVKENSWLLSNVYRAVKREQFLTAREQNSKTFTKNKVVDYLTFNVWLSGL
ncbi:hypothetical protein IMY05_007G0066900 [Salix suchowensis]|nr:hypothetical protein IMY05_007G0066900 [Salix suchowensis]